MKKVLFAILILSATIANAQSKPMPKPVDTVKPQPLFVAVFNKDELGDFLNFLNNVDLYSDKGRQTYIDMFKKKVTVLTPPENEKKK